VNEEAMASVGPQRERERERERERDILETFVFFETFPGNWLF
jgi:hypothetical protein